MALKILRKSKFQFCYFINIRKIYSSSELNADPTLPDEPDDESAAEQTAVKVKSSKKDRKKPEQVSDQHRAKLDDFFNRYPAIATYRNVIPENILNTLLYNNPRKIYLVCPKIAEDVSKHVMERLEGTAVAESNPGLALITTSLINKGVKRVLLYENNVEFQQYLEKKFYRNNKVRLRIKDFLAMGQYFHLEKLDESERIKELFDGLHKKSWTDGIWADVIGTCTSNYVLYNLVKAIILQRECISYGRIDFYFITYEHIWQLLKADCDNGLASRRYYWHTLIPLFLETELITTYPRKFFFPWQTVKKHETGTVTDQLYFVKIKMKKKFLLEAVEFEPFYFFMDSCYQTGNKPIIPICETTSYRQWIPNCGSTLITPQLKHDDYYENINIYTRFSDLNTAQIIAIFRELMALHLFSPDSTFANSIGARRLQRETSQTHLHDANKSK